MTNVLIVEDEQAIRRFLRTALEGDGMRVFEAETLQRGLLEAATRKPDLIILDLGLPDGDGIEFIRDLRQWSAVPVIVLSARSEESDKIAALDAGADDYMVKPFDFRELYARIRVLLKRKLAVVTDVEEELNYADLSVNLLDKSVKRAGRDIKLSPKEYNLLVYMIENAEKVVSRVDIADKVWNTHFDTGTNFIDVYINYLRKKIDRDFDTKLIHTKTGMGFILTDKL
mgnify:CR=1 FL=1